MRKLLTEMAFEFDFGCLGRIVVSGLLVSAMLAVQSAQAGSVFETANDATAVYAFGSSVSSGETAKDNIGSDSASAVGRFAFRSGTVNVKSGGYIRLLSYEAPYPGTAYPEAWGSWLGANGCAATLNIDGGVFWSDNGSYDTSTHPGVGRLRIGVNDVSDGRAGVARLNLSGGTLRVDNVLMCGGSNYNSNKACTSPAEMNISGGQAVVNSFWLGASESGSYSTAALNLTGGEMQVGNFVFQSYHNQSFVWGSGTIAARAANVFSSKTILGGCTRSVTVCGSPSVFDTGNFQQTLPADISSGTGTLRLTGGNTVTLSASPEFSIWLDGTGLVVPEGGISVSSITLEDGASLVFNADSLLAGKSLSVTASGGFDVPDGTTVLDFVTITGDSASDCEASLSADGKTLTVEKPGDANYIWNGAGTYWSDANAWQNAGASATWVNGNVAVFNDAAVATLTADAAAGAVEFNANATVATNGTAAATLTAQTVSVASGVSAAIVAPTAGALTKTGVGTLTLTEGRTDATTLSEGTLVMSGGGAVLDWSTFIYGTDASKPVTLRFADGATLASMPSQMYIGEVAGVTNTLVKECGDWTIDGSLAVGRADGANVTFLHNGGTLSVGQWISIGSTGTDHATMVISGGTVNSTAEGNTYVLVGAAADATLVVTNGAVFNVAGILTISQMANANALLDIANGTVNVGDRLYFGSLGDAGNGTVNLGSGGTLTAYNVSRRCSPRAELNFNGGTLRKCGAPGAILSDGENFIVTVGSLGGTIDNNGIVSVVFEDMVGSGTMNLTGSSTTRFAAGVSVEGGISVASGTTLAVDGTAPVTFGSLTMAAGSSLTISSYAFGVVPIEATTLNLPDSGTVELTLNSGAFTKGVYAICAADNVTAADGAKFAPSTGDLSYGWSVYDGMLILNVGNVAQNAWTGLGGDGRMSTAANWAGCGVPASGSDIDFSFVSSAATINADVGYSFGAVAMGGGVITFTNSLTASSFSDTSKVAVGRDSTVTIDGDLVFSGSGREYICYSVASGGVFRVTGDIVTSEQKNTDYLFVNVTTPMQGTVAARGLLNNQGDEVNYGMSFACANYAHVNWEIGADGLSGKDGRWFFVSTSSEGASIRAAADFTNSAPIANFNSLALDPGGFTITLGSGGESRGGIMGTGTNTIVGTGKVVVNYDIDNQTSNANNVNPTFAVQGTATLALVPGSEISRSGSITVASGATIQVEQSGTVTLGGILTLEEGAALGFNFTKRGTAPQLSFAAGSVVPDTVNVKIGSDLDVKPISRQTHQLTSGVDLTGKAINVVDSPAWVESVSVDASGNLVVNVKPSGVVIIFH